MKTRILAIAPYVGMRELMNDVAAGRDDIDIHVEVGDLEQGLRAVQKYSKDYDVIISRGGTSQLIRRNFDMPVIDVNISVYDVLCAIKSAMSMEKPFAVIGYSNLTDCAKDLCKVMQYDIRIVTITRDMDVRQVLTALTQEGIGTFVCDMIVSTVAAEMGLYAILVLSGTESIAQVFNQAVHLSKSFNYIRRQREILKTIFEKSDQNVLVYYSDGRLWFSTMAPHEEQLLDGMIRPHVPSFFQNEATRLEFPEGENLHAFWCQHIEAFQETYIMVFHTKREIFPMDDDLNSILLYGADSRHVVQAAGGVPMGAGDLREKVLRYAKTNYPVFLVGEAGSEKTQIATLIYNESRFSGKRFYIINCSLLSQKKWRFLLNHVNSPLLDVGCVVFFRNIDVLNEQQLEELIDFLVQGAIWDTLKLVFSLNSSSPPYQNALRSLKDALPGIVLSVPPLRERAEEIPSIAIMYLNRMNKDLGKEIIGFERGAMDLLKSYSWPRNFAQFRRLIREIAVMTQTSYVSENTVREALRSEISVLPIQQGDGTVVINIERPLEEIELDIVRMVLEANDMNQTKTAEILGISRSKIWRMLK